jgi:hypothetical protein
MKDSEIIEKTLQSLDNHGKKVTGCARNCLIYIIMVIAYIILLVIVCTD